MCNMNGSRPHQVGDDERHPMRHKARDEMHIAGQAIERVSALAGFHLGMLGDQLPSAFTKRAMACASTPRPFRLSPADHPTNRPDGSRAYPCVPIAATKSP
jgi:hypothetical protein